MYNIYSYLGKKYAKQADVIIETSGSQEYTVAKFSNSFLAEVPGCLSSSATSVASGFVWSEIPLTFGAITDYWSQVHSSSAGGYSIKDRFLFFINGLYIKHNSIIELVQDGNDVKLVVDPSVDNIRFYQTDVIYGIGKFNN